MMFRPPWLDSGALNPDPGGQAPNPGAAKPAPPAGPSYWPLYLGLAGLIAFSALGGRRRSVRRR